MNHQKRRGRDALRTAKLTRTRQRPSTTYAQQSHRTGRKCAYCAQWETPDERASCDSERAFFSRLAKEEGARLPVPSHYRRTPSR